MPLIAILLCMCATIVWIDPGITDITVIYDVVDSETNGM